MAQFIWKQYPDSGFCLACMTATNDRGFVDLIGETVLKRSADSEETVGVVDVYYCGSCIEQAARLVGCASRKEVEDLVYESAAKDAENEKLKDEIQAWQERFLGLANLDVEDFEKLAKLERAAKMRIVEEDPNAPPQPEA